MIQDVLKMKQLVPLRSSVLAVLLLTPAVLSAQALRATHPEMAERSASLAGAQVLTLTDELIPKLLELPVEKSVAVVDWPLAPDVFQEVLLTRREVYAPDARIYKIGPEGKVEVPRSRLAFFGGGSTDGKSGLWLSIDPETGEMNGSAEVQGELYALKRAAGSRYAVAAAKSFLPAKEEPQSFGCANEQLRPLAGSAFAPEPAPEPLFPAKALASLHTATVAVDTDNELLQLKFNDNTTTATNYLAALFAGMNVMYERDLNVRLLQGTTTLRVSSQPDPYLQPVSGNADSAKLGEFATYWSAHNASIPRALAMMLSGKSPSSNGASGIGYISGLCSPSVGYSFSEVFRSPSFDASFDVKLVGHELGHNFGSDHTHCYSPPADNCYNGEAGRGCYAGTPSCPATTTINGVTNVQGTLMSYCHLLGGCTAAGVFHQRTLDIINPILAGKVGICVFPAGGGGGGATASKFYTVPPCRLIDTRNATGLLGGPALVASGTRSFPVTGACGIPSTAKAVSGNLTVISPAAAGFLNAYATGTPTSISLLSFRAGQVKANSMVLKLPASGGSLTFQNGSGGIANFLFDVNGYFK
jgi:hypothetical protein